MSGNRFLHLVKMSRHHLLSFVRQYYSYYNMARQHSHWCCINVINAVVIFKNRNHNINFLPGKRSHILCNIFQSKPSNPLKNLMAIFMLYTFQILTILIIMSTFEGHVSMSSIFSKFVGLSQEPIIHESVLVMFILFLFNKRM